LEKLNNLISKLRSERNAWDSKLEALRLSGSKNEERIAELEDELSGLAIRRDATEETRRGLDATISEARATRDKVQKALAPARAAAEREQKNLKLLKTKSQASEEALREQQQRLANTEKSLTELERSLAEKESRLEILHQLNEEGEGLAQGSQSVLKGLDNPSRIQPALAGALVSNLDVDPECIAAVEAALGRNLQAIVLNDAELAPEIIATLKKKKIGQAALVLPGLSNSSPETPARLPSAALAWAHEKVKATDSLAPLVARLLHNVAIFRDLDAALSFKKGGKYVAVATLAGEFISAEGIVFGGSRDAAADSLLERKARMSGLSAECAEVRRRRDALLQKRDGANAKLEKARSEFEQTRRQYESADRAQATWDNRILFLERASQESSEKIDQLRSEQTVLAQQIQTAGERIAKL